jgi:hypothetical protein
MVFASRRVAKPQFSSRIGIELNEDFCSEVFDQKKPFRRTDFQFNRINLNSFLNIQGIK